MVRWKDGVGWEPEARIESLETVAAHGIQIRCGDRTHIILLRVASAEAVMSAAGLQTDGQAAAIELDPDGKVLRAMAIGACTLRYKDRYLLSARMKNARASGLV